MSAEAPRGRGSFRIPAGDLWAEAWKVAAVVAVIGIGLSAVGWVVDPHRFAFSWLFAFVTFLTVGLGAVFFIAVQFLCAAHWSVTVRRTAEVLASALPVFALLFVPLAVPGETSALYEWYRHGADEHAQAGPLLGPSVARAQAAEGEEVHGETEFGIADTRAAEHADPQEVLHAELLEHKRPYLSYPFWLARAAIYFLVWSALGLWFFRASIRQDRTRDTRTTVRLQRGAPIALILFALTLTFAMLDWVMSLEPTWYSTIYGVYLFAGTAVTIHALLVVMTLGLGSRGLLGNAVNTEHYHDLGKLTFGFVVFWAYIGFSQMMLQWYANIPEELTFYHYRWHADGWGAVSIILLLGYFVIPFLLLISRNAKRRLRILGFVCSWLLAMHVVDVFWFVIPNVARERLSVSWIDLAALLAVGGVYLTVVLLTMRRHPLIPLGDPRLERSLRFLNA